MGYMKSCIYLLHKRPLKIVFEFGAYDVNK